MTWEKFDIRDLSDSEYFKWYSLMSKAKRERVDRFRFIEDKKRTVAGEMLARKMISKWFDIWPESISFEISENGKPYAVGLNIHFNISHSNNFVVCAINITPIGIDIEQIRKYPPAVAQRICSDKELAKIHSSQNLSAEFTRIWTAKEAHIKKSGIGWYNTNWKAIPSDLERQYIFEDYWISISY